MVNFSSLSCCPRLASDLLLWEPAAPCPVERPDMYATSIGGLDLASQLLEAQAPDRFVMCRSGVRVDEGQCRVNGRTAVKTEA